MSKRKVQFAEGDIMDAEMEAAFKGDLAKKQKETRFKEKHSLDSDEEDNADKYDMLADDDIEGQEDGDVDFKDGVEITPFNMKEELEDGHFDKDGTYIFGKQKEIKDGWLDNINWVQIKERPVKEDSDSDEEPDKVNEIDIFKQMIQLMNPGESVLKSLKRLGGNKSSGSASQRWKKKKPTEATDPAKEAEEKENKEKLLKLTEMADKLLLQGNTDVYQDTYEKIQFVIKKEEEKEEKAKTVIPEDADDDDALDMFAESIDNKGEDKDTVGGDKAEKEEKSKESTSNGTDKEQPGTSAESTSAESSDPKSNEVMWEYKWEEGDEELHGPFSSSQMMEWQDDYYFKDGVQVRKVGTERFYSSRRVDFELYT